MLYSDNSYSPIISFLFFLTLFQFGSWGLLSNMNCFLTFIHHYAPLFLSPNTFMSFTLPPPLLAFVQGWRVFKATLDVLDSSPSY